MKTSRVIIKSEHEEEGKKSYSWDADIEEGS